MNNLSNIMNNMYAKTIFDIHIGNFKIAITDTIISMWFVMFIIILLALLFSRNLKQVPGKKQNGAEMFVDFVKGMVGDSIPNHVDKFIPFIGTMLLFIVLANIVDIINIIIPIKILVPPTKDLNVALALALISMTVVIYSGIKYKKVSGWLRSFTKPVSFILPFKILDYFIKPVSLTLRLFGNIIAGFLIMTLIFTFIPGILPSFASMYFDLFDGILQAYIFAFLTSLYIGEAMEEDD